MPNSLTNSLPNSESHPAEAGGIQGIRYALVTPVRDEERYIGGMIDSLLKQSVLPKRWIIVDDGSTDKTPEIVEGYARGNP
ncbi:MAG: glycosyltransferase family 2 protein, partial [Candidatus Acidiferrales bacterium]